MNHMIRYRHTNIPSSMRDLPGSVGAVGSGVAPVYEFHFNQQMRQQFPIWNKTFPFNLNQSLWNSSLWNQTWWNHSWWNHSWWNHTQWNQSIWNRTVENDSWWNKTTSDDTIKNLTKNPFSFITENITASK